MKLEEVIVTVRCSHRIQRDGPGKVITKVITKDFRLVYDKRFIQSDLITLPYGFKNCALNFSTEGKEPIKNLQRYDVIAKRKQKPRSNFIVFSLSLAVEEERYLQHDVARTFETCV